MGTTLGEYIAETSEFDRLIGKSDWHVECPEHYFFDVLKTTAGGLPLELYIEVDADGEVAVWQDFWWCYNYTTWWYSDEEGVGNNLLADVVNNRCCGGRLTGDDWMFEAGLPGVGAASFFLSNGFQEVWA